MLLGNAPLLLSLIWAQLLSSEMAEAISFYPWGQSLGDRSEAILTKLRDDLSLTMERQWLPEPLASNPDSGLVFTNVDGEEYLCGLEEAAGKNPADTVPLHFYDSQLLSSKLAERCSTITTDYWSYEWCHQRAVTQFHIVNHKDGTDRHPQWSLGKFVSSEVVRERGESSNMSAAITQIVDTYDGGQWCDETQRPRRSEVHIQCCEGLAVLNPKGKGKKSAPTASTSPNMVAFVADLTEPQMCSYHLTVCSALMCHHKITKKSPTAGALTLEAVMKDLKQKCISRQEDWWTYEICFGKSTRQFRVQAVPEELAGATGTKESTKTLDTVPQSKTEVILEAVAQDVIRAAKKIGSSDEVVRQEKEKSKGQQSAKMVMKVVSEFKLGDIASDIALDEAEMYSRVVYKQEGMAIDLAGRQINSSIASMHLEYVNGTSCDLKNTMRSSRVELSCGAELGYKAIEIMDILEDSTCHYLFKVSVPGLCLLDTFGPKKRKTSVLDCLPMEEMTSFFDEPSTSDNIYSVNVQNVEYEDLDAGREHVVSSKIDVGDVVVDTVRVDSVKTEVVIEADGSSESQSITENNEDATEARKMYRMARSTNHNHIKFERKRKSKSAETDEAIVVVE